MSASDTDRAVARMQLNVRYYQSWHAHTKLVLAQEAEGDLEGAIASLQRALDLKPGDEQALERLRALRARAGGTVRQ